jgi:CsoR family transcriptional regulator, copper-sensing transcriptional repressor
MIAARTEASSTALPWTTTVFASRSTSTAVTPATLPTSVEIARSQCAQLIPGTLYLSFSIYPMGVYHVGMAEATPTRGYSASKEQLVARLRRIEGQIRGIERMVEEDRYCIDVVTQISAIQGALEKVALGLLDSHTRHCVLGPESEHLREERTEELVAAFGRLLGRG